jgi:hypothetical protein
MGSISGPGPGHIWGPVEPLNEAASPDQVELQAGVAPPSVDERYTAAMNDPNVSPNNKAVLKTLMQCLITAREEMDSPHELSVLRALDSRLRLLNH